MSNKTDSWKSNLKRRIFSYIAVPALSFGILFGTSGCTPAKIEPQTTKKIVDELSYEWKENAENYLELSKHLSSMSDKEEYKKLTQMIDEYLIDSASRGNEYKGQISILEKELGLSYKSTIDSIDETIQRIYEEIY
ncbi:MAG: hypothetical protein PWR30_337 [Candidatus Woesearchaeota archaeon]|nr:hypothetical protein [Candidatus Woesearchaeota archaeon]